MRVDSHMHLQAHGECPPVDRARLEAYVEAARRNDVDRIVITEHLFRFHEAYDLLAGWWDSDADSLLARATERYWQEHVNLHLSDYARLIEDAKSDGLPVSLGIEMDWIPGRGDALLGFLKPYSWDVVLGSVHWIGAFGFDNPAFREEWDRRDPDRVFSEYVALLSDLAESGLADVLAHPDLPKLFGHRPTNLTAFHLAVVEAASRGGCAIEINTNGLRQPAAEIYPAEALLRKAHEAGLAITLASDAHTPERIGQGFEQATDLARRAGYTGFSAFVERKAKTYSL